MLVISFHSAAVAAAEEAGAISSAQPADVHYRVTGFDARYVHMLAGLPLMENFLGGVEVELAQINGVYSAPLGDGDLTTIILGEVTPEAPVTLTGSAVAAIAEALAEAVSNHPNVGGATIFAAVDPRDIDPQTGRDLRRGTGTLRYRLEYTGDAFLIASIEPIYDQLYDPDPRPSVDQLKQDVRVELTRVEEGFVAWRPGVVPEEYTLADLPQAGYTLAAVQQIAEAVKDYLGEDAPGRGLIGITVRPAIEGDVIRLRIVTGEVAQVRTLASGQRTGAEGPARVNHPLHDRIRENSPLRPGEGEIAGDFLNKRALDEYVYFLQRHPGRRVDVALAPGQDPNTVNVDYLITENRPWLLYGQVSNTGTRQTGRWRVRFGFMHNQLTNNDDVLTLDYNTAEFSDTHAFSGSYEARAFDADRLRWRIHGMWSEFAATDVGIPFLEFNGESWMVGAELIWNALQDRQLFVDVIGGARFMHASVENLFVFPGFVFPISEGDEDFFIPYAGLRLQRTDDTSNIFASLMFEGSVGSVTSIDGDDLPGLGRPFPDRDWMLMAWDTSCSFFLEPLFNHEAWSDPSSPESSTLAHELVLGFKGQYAFGNRLVPQSTMVAGGMFSVRGYPESVVSGDTVIMGSAEYRFHLPRIFTPSEDAGDFFGQPFRWSPQNVYGRPDWDLILRGFVDAARTMNSDRRDFEVDHTLIGAGVGIEVAIRRNFNVRVDWGFALNGLENSIGESIVNSGSSRVHFAATILY